MIKSIKKTKMNLNRINNKYKQSKILNIKLNKTTELFKN